MAISALACAFLSLADLESVMLVALKQEASLREDMKERLRQRFAKDKLPPLRH